MTADPIAISESEVRRYRWRDVDWNVDRFNAAIEEWVRLGSALPPDDDEEGTP